MTRGVERHLHHLLLCDDFGNDFPLNYLRIETCELSEYVCVPDQSISLLNVVVTDLVQAALKWNGK